MKFNKAIIYFVTLIVVLVSLEVLFRFNEQSILSIHDKMLLKKQMVTLRRPTQVLFVGSSRVQDGIEPRVLMDSMAKLDPAYADVEVFNAAATGANINRLEYFVEHILASESLKLLVVEVSQPQMLNRPLGLEFNEEMDPQNTEQHLQKLMGDHVYLVKHRKTFRLDGIRRVPVLMLSNVSVGTELFRRGMLRDWTEQIDDQVMTQTIASGDWRPQLIQPMDRLGEIELDEDQSHAFEVYKRVAKLARDNGIEMLFIIQPLRGRYIGEEFDDFHMAFYASLSNATDTKMVMTQSLDLSKDFFRNDSHLNKMGRTIWSDQLAGTIIEALKGADEK